jgi:hypothetical protein
MVLQDKGDLDQLREAFWRDEAAQDRLAVIADRHEAIAALLAQSRAWGIHVERDDLLSALHPDPLGLVGLTPYPANAQTRPGARWLPVALIHDGVEWTVDWAHFGSEPLSEPFFEDALRKARQRLVSQLLRPRTPLRMLLGDNDFANIPPPDGLVFHMSRCGSTLVARLLGQLHGAIVLSEAAPIDMLLQILVRDDRVSQADKALLLRRMVAALSSDRDGKARRRFIKTDSWHTAALPLFRAAFPQTPWIFLYRDAMAVMLSQKRMPGAQTLPGGYSALLDLDTAGAIPGPAFTARVLAAVCDAAADHAGLGEGLFLAYETLPSAFLSQILPHFGITPDAAELAAIEEASRRDAKEPRVAFDPSLRAPYEGETERLRPFVTQDLARAVARIDALAS